MLCKAILFTESILTSHGSTQEDHTIRNWHPGRMGTLCIDSPAAQEKSPHRSEGSGDRYAYAAVLWVYTQRSQENNAR